MKPKKPPPLLRPVYVAPTLDARQRAAARAFAAAAYSGQRHRPAHGTFDPLHMRLGLFITMVKNRAGWVVSNPGYDQVLTRHPEIDPSIPGPGWLTELYRHANADLVLLDSSRAHITARYAAAEQAQQILPPTPPAAPVVALPQQEELFA